MAIGEDIGKVAEIAAPELGLSLQAAKVAVWAIGGLLVAALLFWVGWKLFFAQREADAKHDQVQTQAVLGTAAAGTQSAKEAIQITVDNGKAAAGIDAAVKGALNEISLAKGADAAVSDEVDAAGRRAVCLRASAAGLPDCQSLQRTSP